MQQDNVNRFRACAIALAIFILFSFLLTQFYKLQITEGAMWEKKAERQHFFTVVEPARRGTFFATAQREDHPKQFWQLVYDVQKFHLHIDPMAIPEAAKEKISAKLIQLLHVPSSKRLTFYQQFLRRSRNRQLAVWLDLDKQQEVASWWYPFAKKHRVPSNALFFVSDYQRSYPFGALLGQLLHTVRSSRDGSHRYVMPTGGLELSCNSYLKGSSGRRQLKRSPLHAFETGQVLTKPKDGADIFLTIDPIIQAIVEEELEKGVANSQAKAGWAIMMKPETGEILALAQYPFFDPSRIARYYNNPELLEHTKVKAISDALEPGSVMKGFTTATALYANEYAKERKEPPLFDPEAKMPTSNGFFPGRSQPLKDGNFYRFMNLDIAIQKSANIYTARLAEQMVSRFGIDWYSSFLRKHFGFGKITGIELPGESAGFVPTAGKKYASGALEWSSSTTAAIAIGYNILITPMQLIRAYAAIANGGFLVQPTLIRKIEEKDEEGHKKTVLDCLEEYEKKRARVLPASVVKRLKHALKFTTKSGGSAIRADVSGYSEAGKTATVKKLINGKYQDIYRASFIGFTPVDSPAFVLLVTFDEPEYRFIPGIGKNHNGGICAAPVFRSICEKVLEYLGIAPDDPHGYPSGDPRSDRGKADWRKETKELQDKCREWNQEVSK
jgi:cell division protein FtsI (penicillin-binding protein 3)